VKYKNKKTAEFARGEFGESISAPILAIASIGASSFWKKRKIKNPRPFSDRG
jgi:hypothetical protein